MNTEEFPTESYVREEFKLDLNRTRLFCVIVLFIAGVIFGLPFFLLWHENLKMHIINIEHELLKRIINIVIFIIFVFAGFIIHELIHGFFAAIFNKNGFKSIRFGIMLSKGIAYCVNAEILKTNKYIIGLLMPLIILGIIPSVLSIFTGYLYLFIFGLLFIIAASGDILLFLRIFKERYESWVEDKVSDNEVKIFIYRLEKAE